MRVLQTILGAILCVTAAEASRAETYTNTVKGYSIEFSSNWTRTQYPTPVDFALACAITVCGEDTRFVANANFVAQAANLSTQDFLHSAPGSVLTEAVQEMVRSFGTVETQSRPEIEKIGLHEGYIGKYRLTYRDGRVRDLKYAITFKTGYMYHLQFFTPAGQLQRNEPVFDQLLSTFKIVR